MITKILTKLKRPNPLHSPKHRLFNFSQESMNILFEYAPDGYYISNLKGTFIYGNKAAEELTGYNRDELIGKNFLKIALLPKHQIPKAAKLLVQNSLGKATGPDEFTLIGKNGRRVSVEICTYPVKIEGKKLVLGIARDITVRKNAEKALIQSYNEMELEIQRRTAELHLLNKQLQAEITEHKKAKALLTESEMKYRTLVETVQEGVVIVDTDENIVFANPTICNILDYTQKELHGMNLRDLVPENEFSVIKDQTEKRKKGMSTRYDILMKRKDGSLRHIRNSATPWVDEKGRFLGCLGLLIDVTDQKYAEEEIKNSLREKETLLQEIHHRVKNNLQIISSLLHLQSSYIKDANALRFFEETQDRIKSMSLIHEKLYQNQNLSSIDIGDYIQTLAKRLFKSYCIAEDNVTLITNIDNIPLDIDTGIPCGLIINELMANTLRHAFVEKIKNRTPEIKIQLRKGNNGNLKLMVADNGVGIPNNINFRKTKSLGLHLVCALVKQLDGKIVLSRQKGTSFTIIFKIPH